MPIVTIQKHDLHEHEKKAVPQRDITRRTNESTRMESKILENQSNMKAIRLIELVNGRGQNDNVPAAKREAAGSVDAYSYLRVESDGSVSDFIVPTDDEIDLMILISAVAASSEEAEAAVEAEARRMYLRKWGIVITGVALLCSAILLL